MISPTGIIPEEMFTPQSKGRVIEFLRAQPYAGDFKEKVLLGWAMWVGLRLRRKDYNAVFSSGVDIANG